MISTVIFDLYGTLLDLNHRAFLRDLVALAPDARRPRDFASRVRALLKNSGDERVAAFCFAIGISQPSAADIERCAETLDGHVKSVALRPGTTSILGFFKRRGMKLACLSNLSAPFVEPIHRFGLDETFDYLGLSCFTGFRKPEPSAYLDVCSKLGVEPADCLFVGDSSVNDYDAPMRLGMTAVRLGSGDPRRQTASDITDLAWLAIGPTKGLQSLLPAGTPIVLGDQSYSTSCLSLLPDDRQGRYNLLGHLECVGAEGSIVAFAKRYLLPESAEVEDMAYQFLRKVGLSSPAHALLRGAEPILVTTRAEGSLWSEASMTPDAFQTIGGHCAAAYIIGNADLRPRNTFVHTHESGQTVSVIDLEHCFFDRALRLPPDVDATDARSIDALAPDFDDLTKHRVLSRSATRRARRSFLPIEDMNAELPRHFRNGWLEVYARAKSIRTQIRDDLLDRIYRDPPLIIGTQAYRRAMARIDVDDIMARLAEDPAVSFETHY